MFVFIVFSGAPGEKRTHDLWSLVVVGIGFGGFAAAALALLPIRRSVASGEGRARRQTHQDHTRPRTVGTQWNGEESLGGRRGRQCHES